MLRSLGAGAATPPPRGTRSSSRRGPRPWLRASGPAQRAAARRLPVPMRRPHRERRSPPRWGRPPCPQATPMRRSTTRWRLCQPTCHLLQRQRPQQSVAEKSTARSTEPAPAPHRGPPPGLTQLRSARGPRQPLGLPGPATHRELREVPSRPRARPTGPAQNSYLLQPHHQAHAKPGMPWLRVPPAAWLADCAPRAHRIAFRAEPPPAVVFEGKYCPRQVCSSLLATLVSPPVRVARGGARAALVA